MRQWQSLVGESPVPSALSLPEECLHNLCRDLGGNGLHDQGQKHDFVSEYDEQVLEFEGEINKSM